MLQVAIDIGSTRSSSVGEVIHKGRMHLEGLQHENGCWQACNLFGPVETAQLLVFEGRYHIAAKKADTTDAIHWLRSQQLPDGSFPPYPGASNGDLSTTCHVYAGLSSAGVAASDGVQRRARAFIDASGGFDKARVDAKIFLHLAGLYDKKGLPEGLLFHKLLPRVDELLIRVFGSWVVMLSNLLPGVLTILKHRYGSIRSPFRRRALRAVESYLWERQHPNGDWFAIFGFTLLATIFLIELGTPLTDPRIKKALAALERLKFRSPDGISVVQLSTEIWDTAWAARTLIECGVPTSAPSIRRAVDYLLGEQARLPAPQDWQNTRRGKPRSGGWGWGEGDIYVPDCDDTGFVVLLLAMVPDPDGRQRRAAEEAVAWLLGMQNDSGGWPVHCHGHWTKRPGALPFDSLYRRLWDTASEEITGRLLSAFARHGYDKNHPAIQRAIGFLRTQVDEMGVWWGGWTLNYLAATSSVLSGLKDIGFDMSDPLVRRAVSWIKSRQNEDGGFGETVMSYRDRRWAGVGPSRPSLSGFVLYGLLDAGEAASAEAKACVDYLCRTQSPLGTWVDGDVQNALSPYDDRYYFNAYMSKYFPLLALAKYRACTANGASHS